MIEKDIGCLDKLEKMSSVKHKERIFKLIWIQGLNIQPNNNYFRVLFKDIYSEMYLIEHIYPEFLSYFTIGSYYKDSRLLNKKPISQILNVSIESTDNNTIKEISEVITDNEYCLSHGFHSVKDDQSIDFTDENRRQLCVVYKNDNQTIIFPCAVIGATFYFTSTSMREQILAQNLEGLYEDGSIRYDDNTGIYRIKMKPGAADSDAHYIIRFATNDFAKSRWNRIKSRLLKRKTELEQRGIKPSYLPIEIDFPVKQRLDIEIRGLKYVNKTTGKEKILVFDILKENSSFDFKVEIERKVEILNGNKNDGTVTLKNRKTTDTIENEVPNSSFRHAIIKEILEKKNPNMADIIVNKEYYYTKDDKEYLTYETNDKEVDISLRAPSGSGNRDVRRGLLQKELKKQSNEEPDDGSATYLFEDFIRLMTCISKEYNVSNYGMLDPEFMPPKYNNRLPKTLRETYDKDSNNRRKFIYASFKYGHYNFAVIKIEQRNLPSGSSIYVLISKIHQITKNHILGLMEFYVKCKKMKIIYDSFITNKIFFYIRTIQKKIQKNATRNGVRTC